MGTQFPKREAGWCDVSIYEQWSPKSQPIALEGYHSTWDSSCLAYKESGKLMSKSLHLPSLNSPGPKLGPTTTRQFVLQLSLLWLMPEACPSVLQAPKHPEISLLLCLQLCYCRDVRMPTRRPLGALCFSQTNQTMAAWEKNDTDALVGGTSNSISNLYFKYSLQSSVLIKKTEGLRQKLKSD